MNNRKRLLRVLGSTLAVGSLAVQPVGMANGQAVADKATAPALTPAWPPVATAPKGVPNVVVILLDDIGFADTSAFGGIAQTPELEKLSTQGLRYNNFNTTALCSPTRAALLTGRNSHRVGFGSVSTRGFPGYNSVWKDSTASVVEVLREHGYSTAAFGKWHNTPEWEVTPTGPYNHWPTGLGFEYWYGFMGGMENQWYPTNLYRNTTPVDAPSTPAKGYSLTANLADEAIGWIDQHRNYAPEKPYFLYFAPGAVHAPHHAPKEWIEKYRGKFDRGWDVLRAEIFERQKRLGVVPKDAALTPRPDEVPAWDSLSADQKKVYERQMEVYAGYVAYADYEVGRIIAKVRSSPDADNTIIMYIVGDNGAAKSGVDGWSVVGAKPAAQLRHLDELGGPTISGNTYSLGWSWMGNTPFKYWKAVASHFGGVRNPMVVSWPSRIKARGEVRSQFLHVTDVAATIYDVTGIPLPSSVDGVPQQPLDGASFASSFDSAKAPPKHRVQYFETRGNRAIYKDGWVAAAAHPAEKGAYKSGEEDFSKDRWELYRVTDDFSEARDLSTQFPGKLNELKILFDTEAKKNDIYPLSTKDWNPYEPDTGKPSPIAGRKELIFLPSDIRIPVADVPLFGLQSYEMTADVTIPPDGASGILTSQGDQHAGFVWYVDGDHVIYENRVGDVTEKIVSTVPLPRGNATLRIQFDRDSLPDKPASTSGTTTLYINDQPAGSVKLASVYSRGGSGASALYIGRGGGAPVSDAYSQPFAFTGWLRQITLRVK